MSAFYQEYDRPFFDASYNPHDEQDEMHPINPDFQYEHPEDGEEQHDYYYEPDSYDYTHNDEEDLDDGDWNAQYLEGSPEDYGHTDYQNSREDTEKSHYPESVDEQYQYDQQLTHGQYVGEVDNDMYDHDDEVHQQDWIGHGGMLQSVEPQAQENDQHEGDYLNQTTEQDENNWGTEGTETLTSNHPAQDPTPKMTSNPLPAASSNEINGHIPGPSHANIASPPNNRRDPSSINPPPSTVPHSAPGGSTLNISLENTLQDSQIYAYVTGKAIDHDNSLFLLSSDGKTPYYPTSEGVIEQDIGIAIHKDRPTTITIPHIAGGRIYFSLNKQLEFTLNPGPALVEPSVTNPSDPNYLTEWGFVELTFNKDQLYANISYVDFVGSIPTGLTLETAAGATQHVSGMAPNGLDGVCEGLMQQHQRDGKGWDQLIVQPNGKPIRVLSLNQVVKVKPDLFADYYDEYIDQVWQHLSTNEITFDTQMSAGVVKARVQGDRLSVGRSQFPKPTTQDVLSCDSGSFATGGDREVNAIIPRIAAAFNRSTLLDTQAFPEDKALHYKNQVTNHYSRIVHGLNSDGKGYAFPYDDVQKTGGPDQSGEVHASDATLLTVTVGGGKVAQH
jgi:hypothetical protein